MELQRVVASAKRDPACLRIGGFVVLADRNNNLSYVAVGKSYDISKFAPAYSYALTEDGWRVYPPGEGKEQERGNE